jgi:hypothetical protein
MNAFNPLESSKRLEAAGIVRGHAEAIASEIDGGVSDLVTKEYFRERLDAALDKQTIRMSVINAGMLTLTCTILGTLIAALLR